MAGKLGLIRSALTGVGNLARNGTWGTLATKTKPGLLNSTAKVMSGRTGKALGAYGLAGFVAPHLGVNLPGSQLAMNATMPGITAMFAAPGAVTSARMASAENQEKLRQDARLGSQYAASHYMSALKADPSIAYRPGAYAELMNAAGIDTAQAAKYQNEQYKPMGVLGQIGSVFNDPQKLIDDRMDREIYDVLQNPQGVKQANVAGTVGKALWGGAKGLFGGAKKVLPYVLPAVGVGGVAHSFLRDKPYNENSAISKGYAATQAAIGTKTDGMSFFERLGARLDPSVAVQAMEQKMPGSIAQWEQDTGERHRPGWLASTMNAWGKGGTPSYYTYDAVGQRHYI